MSKWIDSLTGKPSLSPESDNEPTTRPLPTAPKWHGPTTPDGEPFIDLGVRRPPSEHEVNRTIVTIRPDSMRRLPMDRIEARVNEGDLVVVDLRDLIHMEAQKDACRRRLRDLSDREQMPILALEPTEQLLLIPGRGVRVDGTPHQLGLMPVLSPAVGAQSKNP